MRFAVALMLTLSAAPALAADIDCEGLFSQSATLADFEAAFGKDNVITGTVPGPEGMEFVATTVYPNDPARRMQIRWWDEENIRYFAGVTLARGDVGPLGVKVGMPIEEVEAINGEPFTLLGFYWDYGGAAGFDSGRLSNLPGGCFLNLHFDPKLAPLPDDVANAISGDVDLRSDQKEVRAAGIVVDEINLGYPYPPELEEALMGGDGAYEEGGEEAPAE